MTQEGWIAQKMKLFLGLIFYWIKLELGGSNSLLFKKILSTPNNEVKMTEFDNFSDSAAHSLP